MNEQQPLIYDVFVGNVSDRTNEQEVRQIFEQMGPVHKIRMQIDRETGRSRGFAFIEYIDPNMAIAAIRQLDGYEVGGRKLRVSFSNNSSLKDYAQANGIEVIEAYQSGAGKQFNPILEYNSINNMQLHETWDILDAMKRLVDEDRTGQRAKTLLEAFPQLVGAVLEVEKKLGLISHSQQCDILGVSSQPPSSSSIPSSSSYQPSSRTSQQQQQQQQQQFHQQPTSHHQQHQQHQQQQHQQQSHHQHQHQHQHQQPVYSNLPPPGHLPPPPIQAGAGGGGGGGGQGQGQYGNDYFPPPLPPSFHQQQPPLHHQFDHAPSLQPPPIHPHPHPHPSHHFDNQSYPPIHQQQQQQQHQMQPPHHEKQRDSRFHY